MRYHRTHRGDPISFAKAHFIVQLYLDPSEIKYIQKSTQCGVTEMLLIEAFEDARTGRQVLYSLPNGDLRSDFVQDRVDRSIENTLYWQERMTATDSVNMKRIGDGVLKFVVSGSRKSFVNFPADTVIIDEVDESNQDNIKMAPERLGASESPKQIWVGNPTFPDFGINAKMKYSDQKYFYKKCNRCNHWYNPDWFTHVVKEVRNGDHKDYVILDPDFDPDEPVQPLRMLCDNCHRPLEERYGYGEWVEHARHINSGYYINKLFTSNTSLSEMMIDFVVAESDPVLMQRFYNSSLGLTYLAEGSYISERDLDACLGNYKMLDGCDQNCIMGVDVGTWLDVVIGRIRADGFFEVVYAGRHRNLDELKVLIQRFNVIIGVMDALPEQQMAKSWCQIRQVDGRKVALYRCGYNLHQMGIDRVDHERRVVVVNRTVALDYVQSGINNRVVILPSNIKAAEPVFYPQMSASIRALDEKSGRYVWIKTEKPDHMFHAFGYALTGYRMAVPSR